MKMNDIGTLLCVIMFTRMCQSFQFFKSRKAENGLVFNETSPDRTEFLNGAEIQKRSYSGVEIHAADMSTYMQTRTIEYAREALDRYSTNTKEAAKYIKNKLDVHGGGLYACFVGSSFGYSITYNVPYYLYFELRGYYITVFRR
ncbi:uncharacterized protein [Mytilus edulis]|uniref:uncharacterized protein n=1 Tax=Mytilus edulis TaxID=6550 RepID=UPI0039EECD6D